MNLLMPKGQHLDNLFLANLTILGYDNKGIELSEYRLSREWVKFFSRLSINVFRGIGIIMREKFFINSL